MNFKSQIIGLYNQFSQRVLQLTLRERGLILIVGLMVFYGIWKYAIDKPFEKAGGVKQKQIAQMRQKVLGVQEEMNAILQAHQDDSGESIFEKEKRLNHQVDEVDNKLKVQAESLIEPKTLISALKAMLLKQEGLKLIRLENEQPEALLEPSEVQQGDELILQVAQMASEKNSTALQNIYIHRMTLEFEGPFFTVLKYLKSLEALSWQFFWDDLDYRVLEYPNARVTLKLHTLSNQQERHNG